MREKRGMLLVVLLVLTMFAVESTVALDLDDSTWNRYTGIKAKDKAARNTDKCDRLSFTFDFASEYVEGMEGTSIGHHCSDLRSESADFFEDNGYCIFSMTEIDSGLLGVAQNDCGYAKIKIGEIIDPKPSQLDNDGLKNFRRRGQGKDKWKIYFKCSDVKYKSAPEQSYLCADNSYWYTCDEDVRGEYLEVEIPSAVSEEEEDSETIDPALFICLQDDENNYVWVDTADEEEIAKYDSDGDEVPDDVDCAPDSAMAYGEFACTTKEYEDTCFYGASTAEGGAGLCEDTNDGPNILTEGECLPSDKCEYKTCLKRPFPEICGDHIDNDCSEWNGVETDYQYQYSEEDDTMPALLDRCDLNKDACEDNCIFRGNSCSWVDSATGNNCCGDEGLADLGAIQRSGDSSLYDQYICINNQPNLVGSAGKLGEWPDGTSTPGQDDDPENSRCREGSNWCWIKAGGAAKWDIYTIKKPGEQPYDVFSNSRDWLECKNSDSVDLTAGLIIDDDIEIANRFHCYQEGNHWSWAECQKQANSPTGNGFKVRSAGDGSFALPLGDNTFSVSTSYEEYYGELSLNLDGNLDFLVRFTSDDIFLPANVVLNIIGSNGQVLYENNILGYAVNNPYLTTNHWIHVQVPLPLLYDVEIISFRAPGVNKIEVRNLYLNTEGENPKLCSGQSSDEVSPWLDSLGSYYPGMGISGERVCNELYDPNYVKHSEETPNPLGQGTAWLGDHLAEEENRCCGDSNEEYFVGETTDEDSINYACWNSLPIAEGKTTMNVQFTVEYQENVIDNIDYDTIVFRYSQVARGGYFEEIDSEGRLDFDSFDNLIEAYETSSGTFANGETFHFSDTGKSYQWNQITLPDLQINGGATLTFQESPLKIDEFEVVKSDFLSAGLNFYYGQFELSVTSSSGPDSYRVYYYDPLTGTEFGDGVSFSAAELDAPKTLVYIMAEIGEDYPLTLFEPESTPQGPTEYTYSCPPEEDGGNECTYPLPGTFPYTITNEYPELYELYFVSETHPHGTLITPTNNEFDEEGNLKVKKISQQVLFDYDEDEVPGFFGCSAANHIENVPSTDFTPLSYCQSIGEYFCSYSDTYIDSDDSEENPTLINTWSIPDPSKLIGYAEIPANEIPDEPEDMPLVLRPPRQIPETPESEAIDEATDRSFQAPTLPARNLLSNANFEFTGIDLFSWTIDLEAGHNEEDYLFEEIPPVPEEAPEESDESYLSNTLSLPAPVKVRSEKIAVEQEEDLYLSFVGTAKATIKLVDKDGVPTLEEDLTSPYQFSTGTNSFLVLEFYDGTVKQPMLQKRDHLSPLDYLYNNEHQQRAGAACCPQNYCWNGYACVAPMNDFVYMAEYLGDGRTYRCLAGEWEYRPVKFDWNKNPGGWGFCTGDQQCLVSKAGEPDLIAEDFYNELTGIPACIDNEEFIFDHYCESGEWTSRTKFLAGQLLEIAEDEDYVLYCTDYLNALVNYTDVEQTILGGENTPPEEGISGLEEGLDAPTSPSLVYTFLTDYDSKLLDQRENTRVNNVCVLKFNKGNDRVAFATTLNHPLDDPNSFLTALFKNHELPSESITDGEVCPHDGSFFKCDLEEFGLTGELWYSSELNAIIYSKDSFEVSGFLNSIIDFLTELFSRTPELAEEREFINEAENFRELYLLAEGDKTVKAFMEIMREKETIIAEYTGFSTPICEYANVEHITRDELPVDVLPASEGRANIACLEEEDVQRIEVVGSEGDLFYIWKQLTGKLRVG